MIQDLNGASVLLTGASRGIGRAVALALGGQGARVGLVARTRDQLEAVAAAVRNARGEALPLCCDVSDPDAIEQAVGTCAKSFGRLDVLINNAGVFHEAAVADMALEDWEHTLRVNATAPFLFCRHALPIMSAQGHGTIVNVASTSGIKGYLYQSAYCASKHALMGFTRCLALEAKADNIRVHAICPGGVRTEFIADTYLAERLEGETMLEPENIADLVVFLLKQPGNVDLPEIIVRRRHLET